MAGDPQSEPSVEEMLLARLDGYVAVFRQELDLLERITDQLDPERAEACATAIAAARSAVDDIGLHARGDEADQ